MLDFYGVFIEGRLLVPTSANRGAEKKSYDLWLGGGSDPDLPEALRDLAYVQQITVEIGLSLNSKVTMTFTPTLDIGLELINSKLVNWAGSELEVTIGYATGEGSDFRTKVFGGLVMKPEVKLAPDVVITLTGLGVGYGMNLTNATSQGYYKAGTTPWEAVKQTLTTHLIKVDFSDEDGIFPDFTASERNRATATHGFFLPVKKRKDQVTVQDVIGNAFLGDSNSFEFMAIEKGPRNDWWFVREMLKNYALEMMVIDTRIYIRDAQRANMQPASHTFVLKGMIDTDLKVYPILDFSSPSAYVWLGQGLGGHLQADISVEKKEALEKAYTTSDVSEAEVKKDGIFSRIADILKIPVSRTGQGAYNVQKGNDAFELYPGTPEDNSADQTLAALQMKNQGQGVQIHVGTLGIPDLEPSNIVFIDGMSPVLGDIGETAHFNGRFKVMKVVHDIGTSGMMTKFEGLSNAHSPSMESGMAGVGLVNESKTDVSSLSKGDKVLVNAIKQDTGSVIAKTLKGL